MTMRFRDMPIRQKLLVLTLASSATALALAGTGFLAWDFYTLRSEIDGDLATKTRILAESTSAALDFGYKDDAHGLLASSLKGVEGIRVACLYEYKTRALFARFEQSSADVCPDAIPEAAAFDARILDGLLFGTRMRENTQRVDAANRRPVGWLMVRRDLSDLYTRLRIGATTVLGLLLLAIGASFLISARMQRSIATPLLDLADTARKISLTRDYSLRAASGSRDEIGVVVHAFNDMLDRVTDRTAELSRTNVELQREVQERRRVEGERSAALEREKDANRLKDEFLATLSHELRTPLNAVLGWTRVLRTTKVDEALQTRALESVERNARAQARLIEDLLEVSRIVTGKLRLEVDHVDLATIVDAAVEVVQPAAAAKRLQLTTDIAVRPAMTAGDPDRLQQVVWNLLSNAVKFTPAGGEVSLRLEQRDGYVISVRDSGPGIDAKFLPYVFEPFRQADGTPSREHGGLGLGLAIAKRLVELHGGTIRALSEGERHGAIFEVYLPSVVAGASRAAGPWGDPQAGERMLEGIDVLVVDDEEDVRLLLDTALSAFGAVVRTADSAAAALATIDQSPPDILLSDIGMPHADGFELIRRLRSRPASEGGAIPAIAVTAYATARDRHDAEAYGFQAHVAKPFEPEDVARTVARLSRGRIKSNV